MYFEIIKKEFLQQWTYRANSILGFLSIVLQLIVQVSLWTFLSRSQSNISGISYNDLIIYVVLNTVIGTFTNSNVCNDLGDKVYDGSIVIDIIRPLEIKSFMLAQYFGIIVYKLIFNVIPIVIMAILALKVNFPFDLLRICVFIIGIINASLLFFYINYILGLTSFWLQKIWFMRFYIYGCMALLGGSMIPIWFYPAWLDTVSKFLPFRYIIFEPIQVYIKSTGWQEWAFFLFMQFLWLFVLYLIERMIWSNSERRIFIQGG